MNSNTLPIIKIILASFAFALTHWKKIIKISILPILLALPLLSLSAELIESLSMLIKESAVVDPASMQLPDNTLIYSLLFLYGQANLSINMYRLAILGEQSVSWMPILKVKQIVSFIGLAFFINLATGIPLMLVNFFGLYFLIYFLLIPIVLNYINIAINQPLKIKWNLGLITQMNLFFLQVILPMLIGTVINFIVVGAGLPSIVGLTVKVIIFYWTLINLALCYQLITMPEKKSQS
ncbi:MAG: hypothetical protein FE834_00235 [Gammaproteobacteria bacterium]|uniref:Uncharacterized protein n=1 Tax=hydrothermal vent metagenome TaxID=652676 RepID=A0A1W1E435_9ZZZZ|nr:hypothetical protein [Gammaproteobacteria bacterium]